MGTSSQHASIELAVIVSDDLGFEAGLRQANLQPARGGRNIDLGFVRVSQWKVTRENEYMDCEIDFLISNSRYHQEAIGRATSCDFPGVSTPVRVLSCEDLLLFKAASGRLIDLADIKTLVALHEQVLDYDYMRVKANELRLPSQSWLPTL